MPAIYNRDTVSLPARIALVGACLLPPGTGHDGSECTSPAGSGSRTIATEQVPHAQNLTDVLNMMGNYSGRAAIDKTGLAGQYDYNLVFANDAAGEPEADPQPFPFAIVQQLGRGWSPAGLRPGPCISIASAARTCLTSRNPPGRVTPKAKVWVGNRQLTADPFGQQVRDFGVARNGFGLSGGLSHRLCSLPSRRTTQPCRRRCRSSPSRFIRRSQGPVRCPAESSATIPPAYAQE